MARCLVLGMACVAWLPPMLGLAKSLYLWNFSFLMWARGWPQGLPGHWNEKWNI